MTKRRADIRQTILDHLSVNPIMTTRQLSKILNIAWYSVFATLVDLEKEGKIEQVPMGNFKIWRIKHGEGTS
jgi:Mn-dependent DtxR family transcriptional regulator